MLASFDLLKICCALLTPQIADRPARNKYSLWAVRWQAVRYQMMPERVVHLAVADAAKQLPNFLMDELPERLKRGPLTFHLRAQLAAPGDSTKDPTIPWPNDRKLVELGVLTIDKAVPDSAEAEKKLLFLPGALTDGIEKSNDALIDVRDGA